MTSAQQTQVPVYERQLYALLDTMHDTYNSVHRIMDTLPDPQDAGDPRWKELYTMTKLVSATCDLVNAAWEKARDDA